MDYLEDDVDMDMDGIIVSGAFSPLGPPVPPPNVPPKKEFSCKRCCFSFCNGLRRAVMFIVSHVGLVAIVVGYCLAGAFTFEKLERQNELEVKDGISDIRAEVAEDIWRLTNDAEVLKAEDWMVKVSQRMKKFEHELITAMRVDGWNGHETHEKTQWTFTGSLFYSIVCITTIGYGDQTPKTAPGKIVTILYAILGMPLMLFCLSSTGHAMAQSFRFLYWRVCCFLCLSSRASQSTSSSKRNHQRMMRDRHARSINRTMSIRSSMSMGARTPGGRSVYNGRHTPRQSSFNYSDSLSNDDLTQTANNASPTTPPQRLIPQIFAPEENGGNDSGINEHLSEDNVSGRQEEENVVVVEQPQAETKSNVANCVKNNNNANGSSNSEDQELSTNIKREDDSRDSKKSQKSVKSLSLNLPVHRGSTYGNETPSPNLANNRAIKAPSRSPGGGSIRSGKTMLEDDFMVDYPAPPTVVDFYEEQQEDVRKRDIPLWICGVLVIGYIVGGAFLFTSWEKWTFLDSAYFCFITLTTIGFGDFVPKAEQKENTELSIILCSVYLIFGMSLLVMTFNLVQQRVVDQVRRMAQKLGIIRDESFDYD